MDLIIARRRPCNLNSGNPTAVLPQSPLAIGPAASTLLEFAPALLSDMTRADCRWESLSRESCVAVARLTPPPVSTPRFLIDLFL